MRDALSLECGRLGHERLRRRVPLRRARRPFRPGAPRWPHRLAGDDRTRRASLLGRLRHWLDPVAVDYKVGEDRRARNVVIPDAVVHQLVVPLALAGLQVERDEAFREQRVSGDLSCYRTDGRHNSRRSAVRPACRRCRALRRRTFAPRRRYCLCRRPRIRFPRLVAELARSAESCGISTRACRCARRSRGYSLWCCVLLRGAPPSRCAAPITIDVLRDDRRGMQADFRGRQVEACPDRGRLQIDDAVGAEVLTRCAGLRIERDHPVAGGHVDMRSSLPSLQYESPRPDNCAARLRRACLRRSLCIHSISPVVALERDRGAPRAGGDIEAGRSPSAACSGTGTRDAARGSRS